MHNRLTNLKIKKFFCPQKNCAPGGIWNVQGQIQGHFGGRKNLKKITGLPHGTAMYKSSLEKIGKELEEIEFLDWKSGISRSQLPGEMLKIRSCALKSSFIEMSQLA